MEAVIWMNYWINQRKYHIKFDITWFTTEDANGVNYGWDYIKF